MEHSQGGFSIALVTVQSPWTGSHQNETSRKSKGRFQPLPPQAFGHHVTEPLLQAALLQKNVSQRVFIGHLAASRYYACLSHLHCLPWLQSHRESFQPRFPDEESLYMNAESPVFTKIHWTQSHSLYRATRIVFQPDSTHVPREKQPLYLLEPAFQTAQWD